MRPSFFIVGAPKCGTTALYDYLRENPCVFLPDVKEPHFFCADFPGYGSIRSLPDYLKLFQEVPRTCMVAGEASVFYLYSQVAVKQLLEFEPNARLVVMLRDPVPMLHSLHSQQLFNFRETEPDFEKAWRMQPERLRGENLPPLCETPLHLQYAAVGRLGEQLQRVYRHASREQVHVIFYDDFAAQTGKEYEKVLKFIGAPPDGRTAFPKVNANKTHRFPRLSQLAMRPPFPLNIIKNGVRSWLGTHGASKVRELIYWSLTERPLRTSLRAEFIAEIRQDLADDVRLLEDLTGRDLRHWRDPAEAIRRAA